MQQMCSGMIGTNRSAARPSTSQRDTHRRLAACPLRAANVAMTGRRRLFIVSYTVNVTAFGQTQFTGIADFVRPTRRKTASDRRSPHRPRRRLGDRLAFLRQGHDDHSAARPRSPEIRSGRLFAQSEQIASVAASRNQSSFRGRPRAGCAIAASKPRCHAPSLARAARLGQIERKTKGIIEPEGDLARQRLRRDRAVPSPLRAGAARARASA